MNRSELMPEMLSAERADGAVTVRMKIPSGLFWFRGHFPGRPVLPGVAQLAWVLEAASELEPGARIQEIEQLKFMRPIVPGDEAILAVRRVSQGGRTRLVFDYSVLVSGEPVPASKGRLLCGRAG